MNNIAESSISRIYKHLTDKYTFIIISSFRRENHLKVNLYNHLKLKEVFR